jgi:hypothetical protein
MEMGKSQIEKSQSEYNELSQQMMEFEINFYEAVKKLMQLCWHLLLELVKVWQEGIKEAQKGIRTCPECHSKLYTVKTTNPILIFPFGRIYFYNRRVRCSRCKYKESLLRWWLPKGLENRITPLLGEKLIWLSAMMPYREIQFYLKEFWGLDLSLSGIQKYVRRMGKRLLKATDLLSDKIELINESWEKVYIYVDGVMLYINNRWCETKVGIIECHKKGQVHYYYHSEKVQWKTFLGHLHEISEKIGCSQAKIKLFISDAGRGITGNVFEIFKDFRYLIDYYHASEHISVFLKSLGERRKEVLKNWRDNLTSLLIKGKIKELVNSMETLLGTKKSKILLREIAYFRNHAPYFDYASFRQHKWWIGSGKVESACRWLIQQRFKLSGMRWKLDGFQLILGLRLAFYNNRLFPAFRAMTMPEAA